MAVFTIFVVEDDAWYKKILSYHLSLNPDYEVTTFETGRDCLENLKRKPDLITVDYSLPDMKGDELFKKIKTVMPNVPVIIISSQEDVSVAVKMLKMGAKDYLVKDEATKELLWNSILKIRENQSLIQEVETLKEELGQKYAFEKTIIGQSKSLKKIFSLL
jgi:DNA-binding NtrC family response regulator